MIMWMQRHKKWLIITIWISTIAFVGAGSVGWGSYTFGSSSGGIATVGNKKIKITDLQNEYSSLYSKYKSAFGETFNQEMAKQFKLEEAAYNSLVQKFLLLNYADDLGLYITDKEFAKYIVQIPAFSKDGKFDINIYKKILKQNRRDIDEYEKQIKRDLLIEKVQLILNANITKKELTNLSSLYSIQDKVKINIINKKDLKLDISLEKIKEYWEQNKQNYKSIESYKIALTKVKISNDKKATKKDALKKYLKLKKGELKFDKTITISEDSNILVHKNINKIIKTSTGKILKPIEDNGYFVITKVISKIKPQVLSFEKANKMVTSDYKINKISNLLAEKTIEVTKKFTGKDIGFVGKNLSKEIKGLSKAESIKLITHILNSSIKINSISLDDKVVIYKIIDSKISIGNNAQNIEAKNTLKNLKNNEIITNLLKQLKNKYEVTSNMKVN